MMIIFFGVALAGTAAGYMWGGPGVFFVAGLFLFITGALADFLGNFEDSDHDEN